jgi:hypothetical protein
MHLRFNYILIESEGETKMTLPKEHLEDEIWSIRMSPENYHLRPTNVAFFLSAFEASKRSSKCDSVNRKATK